MLLTLALYLQLSESSLSLSLQLQQVPSSQVVVPFSSTGVSSSMRPLRFNHTEPGRRPCRDCHSRWCHRHVGYIGLSSCCQRPSLHSRPHRCTTSTRVHSCAYVSSSASTVLPPAAVISTPTNADRFLFLVVFLCPALHADGPCRNIVHSAEHTVISNSSTMFHRFRLRGPHADHRCPYDSGLLPPTSTAVTTTVSNRASRPVRRLPQLDVHHTSLQPRIHRPRFDTTPKFRASLRPYTYDLNHHSIGSTLRSLQLR